MSPDAAAPDAYGPLRTRALLLQLLVLSGAEGALFVAYRSDDADFHWATHFLVGVTVAALLNLLWLTIRGAVARAMLLSLLAAHLFAMAPDLLFRAGFPHEHWMNLFLGHVWVHYVPGGVATWLALALGASGIFCACLAAWLRARALEAAAGLQQNVGVGGVTVFRPRLTQHTVAPGNR